MEQASMAPDGAGSGTESVISRDEVSVWVDASPETVWGLVADIERYGEWSPENTGGRWINEPGPGATFEGTNRRGFMRWSTQCTVVEYERPSRFGFEVKESKTRWGYRIEAENGGTRLTEWRVRFGLPPLLVRMVTKSGLVGRDRERIVVEGMRETLERVKTAAEAVQA
jgi:hypothetical protein